MLPTPSETHVHQTGEHGPTTFPRDVLIGSQALRTENGEAPPRQELHHSEEETLSVKSGYGALKQVIE